MKRDEKFLYVENVVEVQGSVKNKDFIVLSKVVITNDYNVYSLEGFKKLGLKEEVVLEISNTPFPYADGEVVFYLLNESIDISLAIECGLGVVKFLDGENKGRLGIYFSLSGTDEKWDDIDGITALKIYLQLKHPENYYEQLHIMFNEHRELIESLISINRVKHLKKLSTIFKTHSELKLN